MAASSSSVFIFPAKLIVHPVRSPFPVPQNTTHLPGSSSSQTSESCGREESVSRAFSISSGSSVPDGFSTSGKFVSITDGKSKRTRLNSATLRSSYR
ncbi:hypothetical protein C5Q97_19805 [Victivallales bacterium CCUG 44730]|nr:hypothetical protein C5Q97_19805 [Victivallales bacterium CCUG 44730]